MEMSPAHFPVLNCHSEHALQIPNGVRKISINNFRRSVKDVKGSGSNSCLLMSDIYIKAWGEDKLLKNKQRHVLDHINRHFSVGDIKGNIEL